MHACLLGHECAETNMQGGTVQSEHVGVSGSPECECARGTFPPCPGQHVHDLGRGEAIVFMDRRPALRGMLPSV